MNRFEKQNRDKKRKDIIAWIIREWDCQTLEEVIELSKKDADLRLALTSQGVYLPYLNQEQK